MDDKPDNVPATPDLAAAVRQARVENAERAEAIADLRELEMGRLRALESALKPVIDQAPPDVDLFDLALAPGDHPRLFLDMIAFVDMAHDRRTFRFYQDTRHGRVLIAESQSADAIAAAAADYVARRLVERERALAADWRVDGAPPSQPRTEADGPRAWPIAKPRPLGAPPAGGIEQPAALAGGPAAQPQRGFARRLGDALSSGLDDCGGDHARALNRDWRQPRVDGAVARSLGAVDRRAAVLKGPCGHDSVNTAPDNPRSPASSKRLREGRGKS